MIPNSLKLLVFLLVMSAAALSRGEGFSGVELLGNGSVPDFEGRLEKIDRRLDDLARFSLQSGVGSIGYWSRPVEVADQPEWVEIDFEKEEAIDQVVLVPAIWRDTREGLKADAFPLEFRLIIINSENPEGREIASFGPEDGILPRIAPLIVPLPEGTTASKIRLEVTVMSPRIWDGRYVVQIAEILVFSGEENVALGQPVSTSSPQSSNSNSHSPQAAVDGFVPFLMDAASGEKSLAAVGNLEGVEPAVIEIDLKTPQVLSWLHLHRTDLSDSVPQAVPTDFGVPKRLLIEGATSPDFSDAVVLVDYRKHAVHDAGPIIMRRFPEARCRYVRFTAVEPYQGDSSGEMASQLGFAEIEIFDSEGKNVAKGSAVKTNYEMVNAERISGALTDGLNFHGEVLSIREWMNQLAERHELEQERPELVAELGRRYERQKDNLRNLGWLIALLMVSAVTVILVYRILQMRQIARIRERLAADLHDELGANLHTIGLLSDMADDERNSSSELSEMHRRIRSETVRSGVAVRHCADMLEAGELYNDLVGDMKRSAKRILAKHNHQFSHEGEANLLKLTPRQRSDLFLFYKECLVNASRHSGASEFRTELNVTPGKVSLTITDNGQGLPNASEDRIPPSLQRRAKLLGAKVSVESSSETGTKVNLKLKNSKWRLPA